VNISTPSGAARLALFTVSGLFIVKVVVGVVTGSISIWAQAVDSSLDIFAIVITFLTVGFSAKPADKEHPFGHGKAEDIAAGTQTVFLFVAASLIIYSAIRRIIYGATIELTEAGIAVMLVSMIVSILLSRHLFRVARATGSVALEANATNITGDIYSTAGVFVGLVVVRFTKLTIIDPILALLVSILILRATYRVGRMALEGLIDVRLPRQEEEQIASAIKEHTSQLVGFHEMRTRKAGSQRFIDLHLMLPKNVSLEEAHKMCDHLEEDIKNRLPNSSVTIHVEPCNVECAKCLVSACSLRIDVAISRQGHRAGQTS
jgi:cation diffusion facilitator family transporter